MNYTHLRQTLSHPHHPIVLASETLTSPAKYTHCRHTQQSTRRRNERRGPGSRWALNFCIRSPLPPRDQFQDQRLLPIQSLRLPGKLDRSFLLAASVKGLPGKLDRSFLLAASVKGLPGKLDRSFLLAASVKGLPGKQDRSFLLAASVQTLPFGHQKSRTTRTSSGMENPPTLFCAGAKNTTSNFHDGPRAKSWLVFTQRSIWDGPHQRAKTMVTLRSPPHPPHPRTESFSQTRAALAAAIQPEAAMVAAPRSSCR